jgi:hypothetical protein
MGAECYGKFECCGSGVNGGGELELGGEFELFRPLRVEVRGEVGAAAGFVEAGGADDDELL